MLTEAQIRDEAREPETLFEFVGFAISDCVIEVEEQSIKYLRAVHRTALEVGIRNLFGKEIGGFWLTPPQIYQLRTLTEHYPANESNLVARVVELYLRAQLQGCYSLIATDLPLQGLSANDQRGT